MSMGKGFEMPANLDVAELLTTGYQTARYPGLPAIKIVAICNDAVATLVSFAYQKRGNPQRKAAMGLIVGTGSNATIPLAITKLHPSKRPQNVKVLNESHHESLRIVINTEWTINGAAAPLKDHGFVTGWDEQLDAECDEPGFQPFELMTAGRYLGELGRLIAVDYFTNHLKFPNQILPSKLQTRYALTTTFLGNLRPPLVLEDQAISLKQLNDELPPASNADILSISHVVLEKERKLYNSLFEATDEDKHGFFTKEYVYHSLKRKFGVDEQAIAGAWKLTCPKREDGLNEEEFALIIHLVVKGSKNCKSSDIPPTWEWTPETASIMYLIAKAGMTHFDLSVHLLSLSRIHKFLMRTQQLTIIQSRPGQPV
jgi:hypothetical protein